MLEIIRAFFQPVAQLVNLDPLIVAGVCLALVIALLITIIAVIVKCAKKRKAKKSRKVEPQPIEKIEEKPQEQAVQPEPIAATEVKEEQAVVEPIIDEQTSVPEKEQEVKKPVVKTSAKPKSESKTTKKLNGKWVIELKSAGEYIAKLLASNGEVMLCSETYTTEDGARNGITTIIKGIDSGKFVIYQDKNGNYYYKLKTANNRLLCVGEIYKSKDQCLKAVDSVKRIASSSPIIDGVNEGVQYVKYTPQQLEVGEVKKGQRGKWRIEFTETGNYTAKLYANNGQLMLATEEVALEKSAKNAIASVKKNAEEGNFIIDRDKFGRFYYKLRNAQKSVICIGEAYDTLESCVRAIESVRRFALVAPLVVE